MFSPRRDIVNIKTINNYTTSYLRNLRDLDQVKTRFFELKLRFESESKDIWFIQKCIKNALTPCFVKSRVRLRNCGKATKEKIEKAVLKEELKKHFSIRDSTSFYMYVLHMEWSNTLSFVWEDLVETIKNQVIGIIKNKKTPKLENKLKLLINRAQKEKKSVLPPVGFNFFDRVQNLSNISFSREDMNLLEKGIKFVPSSAVKEKTLVNVFASIDCNQHINEETKMECVRTFLNAQQRGQQTKFNIYGKVISSLKNKIEENELTLVKADKGNTIVILPKKEYIQKTENFLLDNNFKRLPRDPTTKIKTTLKSTLKTCNILLNERQVKTMIPMNPRSPLLYGLMKLHKENIPIRPVVSFIDAPSVKISKFLKEKISELTGFCSKFGTKNTADFIEKTRCLTLENNVIMVSFDVANLFTNVPVQDCIKTIEMLLLKKNVSPMITLDMLTLLKECMQSNYLKFNNKFYETDTLPMGSPLSPICAEIFMDHFEKTFFESGHNLLKNIVFWTRYVDDVFCLWSGSREDLDVFLGILNSQHSSINFTMEVEEEKRLSFLDLLLEIKDGNLCFDIYRKRTTTSSTINSESCHPWGQKLSGFVWLLDRLVHTPLSIENYEKELNIIKHLALDNGYEIKTIEKLLEKRMKRKIIETGTNLQNRKELENFCCIPYKKGVSEGIGKILGREGLKIAYKNENKLGEILGNAKDKVDKWKKSGVYKLNCGCGASYVGKTGRTFQQRIKEHEPTSSKFSEFKNHLAETGHLFREDKVEFLHIQACGRILDWKEKYEIQKSLNNPKEKCLNTQIESSPVIKALLRHREPS